MDSIVENIIMVILGIIMIGCFVCLKWGGIEGIYQYTHQKNDTDTYNETIITDENCKDNSYNITGTIIINEN